MDWRGLWVYKTAFYPKTTGLETSLFLPTSRASQTIPPGPGLGQRGVTPGPRVHCPGILLTVLKKDPAASSPCTPPTRHQPCLACSHSSRGQRWKEGSSAGSGEVCQFLGVGPRLAQVPVPLVSAQQAVLLLARPGSHKVPSKES